MHFFTRLLPLCLAALLIEVQAKDPALMENLDFTKGDVLPKGASHDWTLGPIGARGWAIVSARGAAGSTLKSRQVLITQVDGKGPSADFLKRGDVILGVNGKPFTKDARVTFAKALSPAEGSTLNLTRFRDGKTEEIAIPLPALPPFSATAPYDCPKSAAILAAGCEVLAKHGLNKVDIPTDINALALLASGDSKYAKIVEKYAHDVVKNPPTEKNYLPVWQYSFANIFLSEYYLATGDRKVLPEIRRLTGGLVAGQGPLGTWGHSFVNDKTDRLNGYGAVNAVGVPAAISLVLARECGVEFTGLDESIELSTSFFRRHVGLGAIPYGDGPPNLEFGHDDNGKNSAAAIFFNLLGDSSAADYYTRTALAAFNYDREQGHTGNFFNILWSLPAISLAGPDATGAWLEEFGWYYDLARDPKYRFLYQGYPRERKGSAHSGWYCPGAYLLHYALPMKKIRLTGSKPSSVAPFNAKKIQESLDAGHFQANKAPDDGLRLALSFWSPYVRDQARRELRKRKLDLPGADLNSEDPLARVGALRVSKDFDADVKLLTDPDMRVRIAALETLASQGKKKAIGPIFEHLADTPDESPVFTQAIGNTFFPLTISAKNSGELLAAPKDRKKALIAIERLINDEDSLVASRVAMGLLALPKEEVKPLLPLIHKRAMEPPVGNVMFANKLQTTCAEVLTKYQLKEGLETSVALLTNGSWGRQSRLPAAARLVIKYKGHAKSYLPELKESLKTFPNPGDAKWRKLIQDTIDVIEGAKKENKPLNTISKF